jgi:histidyl-tRNA synthetase
MEIKKLRGMADIVTGGEVDPSQFLKVWDIGREVAEQFGYSYIEPPILEVEGLFSRSVGESSDIVRKEMYTFADKGGRGVALRPEGTAGVVRAFIENRLDRKGGKYRFWYFGPMFRYERPQKGRYRQFHQFGVEFFGEESPLADVEVIQMGAEILDRLGIKYRLKLNSLGCPKCSPNYRRELVQFLEKHRSQLCPDCRERLEKNPIRTLDCKNPNCREILKYAPILPSHLCEECNSHFRQVKEGLERLNIPFEEDPRLVRGLDYYTRTAFEFVGVGEGVGAQNAIIGGGRYDRLVEFLGGKPTPAVGFAVGVERIIPLITTDSKREGVYLGAMVKEGVNLLPLLAHILRKEGEKVWVEYTPKSLKAHLRSADKRGVKEVGILGEEELKKLKEAENLERGELKELLWWKVLS